MLRLPDFDFHANAKTPGKMRAEIERAALRRMLRLMPQDQRRLVEMVILNHQSHRAAAAELHMVPGVVSRRVRQLRNRLACPIRRALALHLDTLPEPTRGLAVDFFFGGVTRRELARRANLNERDLQTQLDYIRGWIRALNRRHLAERRALAIQLDEQHEPMPQPTSL